MTARIRDGLRVRMVRPTAGAHGAALWCAGSVPVGTLGTVRTDGASRIERAPAVHIEWDRIKSRAGFLFGLPQVAGDRLPADYEEVTT